ncbi:MAG: tetratricopeptide repeat protein, partial [Blastocatellia bacterium]|nr:tetratricopeptide repeat protein [Blastocatellia bacterium]
LKGRFSEAIKVFRKGLELKPYCTEADVRIFLADALVKSDQIAEACVEWKRVLEIEPGYPSNDAPQEEAKMLLAKHCQQP